MTSVREVVAKLREAGLGELLLMGNTSEPVCEIPVELNKVGGDSPRGLESRGCR